LFYTELWRKFMWYNLARVKSNSVVLFPHLLHVLS
jgi:hypothetical protein